MSFRRDSDSCSSSIEEDKRADLESLCNRLIRDLQHATHALVDLMLYLDTHPMDFRARQQYMLWTNHYHMLKHQYQKACGPLQWYGPNWWQRAMGFGYDPLDDCFEQEPMAYGTRDKR